jgi:RHS repeat-associated protein
MKAQFKTSSTLRFLSLLLAYNMATPEVGQLPTGLASTLICLCSLTMAEASQLSGVSLRAKGAPAEPPNPPGGLKFSAEPTDAEISGARVFDEPLVPADGQPKADENRTLAGALAAYAHRTIADDCSSLADFADNSPQSRWTASLLLHLGTEYYNYGYFSKALDAWQRAWAQYQTNDYPPAKPQADRALGELARMYSRIGRVSELSALLDSAQGRDLAGPGSQLVHAASEARWIMKNKPDYAFGCGPSALDRILLRFAPSKAGSPVLLDCKSGTNGFALTQVAEISRKLGMNYQMAYRQPGAPLIVPSVVHWKLDHYAALIERRDDRILVQDYTFLASLWVSERALNEETSGYYLVPTGMLPKGWRAVSESEGQSVRGKGLTNGNDTDALSWLYDLFFGGSRCSKCRPCDESKKQAAEGGGLLGQAINAIQQHHAALAEAVAASGGMATYTMHALLASLTLADTPVRFTSPVGPQVAFTAIYNQRAVDQPATFYYSNLGPKWDCSWLSYITDNPSSPTADVALYLDGGGMLRFRNFNPLTQSYSVEAMSQTLLVRLSSSSYELRYPDGSRREYAASDGSAGSTRRIFLTQVIDPAGNPVQLNYDSQLRITSIVNAIGQAMTLSYTNTSFPFVITSVSDPFGRTAQLLYNTNGLLIQITDVLGLISQYTYGANQFITALTTPYGTTTFTTGTTNGGSFITATDPLGGTEAVEYSQALPVPHALPASEVPHGLSTFNLFIDARDSFYWDKKAFAEGAWDWSKARIYHWLHQSPSGNVSARILESEKDPLEGRIWYNYPGQSTNFGAPYYLDAAYTGASSRPSVVARVMDDGTTQLSSYEYNALGKVSNSIDPLGRSFTYIYATNNVDLLAGRMTHNGKNELLSSATYNSQHQPLTITDAAGQMATLTYNSRGQILTIIDPKNETIAFAYDPNGFLLSVKGPLPGTNDTATFTYDSAGRVRTATDTEGYTLTYSYDNFERLTLKSFPDGTSEQFVYDRLDLVAAKDRLGRWTTNAYNANRQLVSVRDPLGRITRYDWCKCGLLEAITDPMGRTTSQTYDLQSRPIMKEYADGSIETYAYEPSSGRLHARQDASGQQAVAEYYADNTLKSVAYLNAINPTPTVSFTYDPDYNRVLTMQDGVGTTVVAYNPITPIPSFGAGELHSLSGPLPNSTVTYQYDALGRIVSRAINGVAQSVTYDVLSRVANINNALGVFEYSYLNATPRLTAAAYPNGQTNLYSYYDNVGDQRLKQIRILKPDASLLSGFGYTYNAAGEITSWTNQWDTLPSRVWEFNYDAADQLTGAVRTDGVNPVSANSYAYDAAGNRTLAAASGTTNGFSYNALNQIVSGEAGLTNGVAYGWDGAHRLTAINHGSHRSEFTYDGMGRRARIVEKESGAVVADNFFLWCGTELCEERDATGAAVVRRFFPQGESVIGAGGPTNLFYTRDHLGSVREALDSTGMLRARYDYDPYGQQTILAESVIPSFGYTGHFQHKPSGLYFALYRGFDPKVGRWLNRDPIAEAGGLNLYAYVQNDPVNNIDPTGQCEVLCIIVIIAVVGAVGTYIGFKAKGESATPHDYLVSPLQGPGMVDPDTIKFTADAMGDFAESAKFQKQQADQLRAYKEACGEPVKPEKGIMDPLLDLLRRK